MGNMHNKKVKKLKKFKNVKKRLNDIHHKYSEYFPNSFILLETDL